MYLQCLSHRRPLFHNNIQGSKMLAWWKSPRQTIAFELYSEWFLMGLMGSLPLHDSIWELYHDFFCMLLFITRFLEFATKWIFNFLNYSKALQLLSKNWILLLIYVPINAKMHFVANWKKCAMHFPNRAHSSVIKFNYLQALFVYRIQWFP